MSTALLFTLFTAYQVYLLVVLKTNWENRVGRLSGIILFIFISVSTVFAIIPRPVFRVLSSVLLIVGLSLNIIFKLTNAIAVFERLNFAVIPSVLNCAVYVGSQVAAFVLLLYFVVFRRREKVGAKRILAVVLMSFVIALYVVCLVSECILLIKYRIYIDLGLKSTVASRFCYYFAFIGMAVGFMLPKMGQDASDLEQYYNPAQSKAELVFSSPDEDRVHPAREQNTEPDEAQLVFSPQEKSKRHAKNKNQSNRSPVLDDAALVFSSQERSKGHSKKDHPRSPVLDDAALVFSSPNEERVIPEKDDDPARGGNKSRKNKDSV